MSSKDAPSDKSTSHDLGNLAQSIGYVTIAWAYLEVGVDMLIDTLHSIHRGAELGLELPRTAFNRKTAYLRDWFKLYEDAQSIAPEMISVADKLDELSEHRHWATHGALLPLTPFFDTGSVILQRRHKKTREHWQRETNQTFFLNLRDVILWRGSLVLALASKIRGDHASYDEFRALAKRFRRGFELREKA